MKILEKLKIKPVLVEDELVISLKDFGRITQMTTQRINYLITQGNRLGIVLRTKRIGAHPFIPISEFINFKFTSISKSQYFNFDETGKKIYHDIVKSDLDN